MQKFQAVLFDFDGTLVNTMPLHYRAYSQVFAEIGLTLTQDKFYGNIGGKASATIQKFLGEQVSPIPLGEIHARKKAVLAQLLETAEIIQLEAAKLLPLLAPFYPLALVSSGSAEGIKKMLEKLGWMAYFSVVVTGEDVRQGKPDPEPYLLAAQQLAVLPANCMVFEDTEDGLLSAVRAGMVTFDVRKVPPVGGNLQ